MKSFAEGHTGTCSESKNVAASVPQRSPISSGDSKNVAGSAWGPNAGRSDGFT